ncbi:15312_t:CDS:2 [Acaulospora colombiana]|uniref:15312_t:CDS:1 n=1 Tax=Acaulospora colombiana TaxID=27376 RepID=A0ACA9KA71_9GLOM|nr:15312_t:CDS:2 [Acaulospora colombiana]
MRIVLFAILVQACLLVVCDTDYTSIKGSNYFERPKDTSIADPYPFIIKEKYSKGLNFLAFGDWGQRGNATGQPQVAQGMKIWADKYKVDFLLNLGDSFYQDSGSTVPFNDTKDHEGVLSINDPKWKTYWLDEYGGNLRKIPWYSVAGNHDWYTNVTAEVDYFWDVDWRFFLPSLYYVRRVYFGPKNTCAVFIHIDTDPYYYNYTSYNSTNNLKKTLLQLKLNEVSEIKSRLKWIEDQLIKAQDADWIFVVGHHPLEGFCQLQSPNYYLMYLLPPVFKKYGVSAYFNGHSHELSYSAANSTSPVTYFCSGAGGATLGEGCGGVTWTAGTTFGFLYVNISDDGKDLYFEYVNCNQTNTPPKVLKSGNLKSRKYKS